MAKNQEDNNNYLLSAKNYKTMPPEKQKELFNHITFSVAQNTKIPFANFIRKPICILISIAIVVLFFIFSENKTYFEILVNALIAIGPVLVIMYKLTQKRKEDII